MTEYLKAQEGGSSDFPEKTKLLDGTEGTMLLEFCKKYNCTLLLVAGEKGRESGRKLLNWDHF